MEQKRLVTTEQLAAILNKNAEDRSFDDVIQALIGSMETLLEIQDKQEADIMLALLTIKAVIHRILKLEQAVEVMKAVTEAKVQ